MGCPLLNYVLLLGLDHGFVRELVRWIDRKTFLWANHRQTFEKHRVQHEEISPYISLLRLNGLGLRLLLDI